MAQFADSFPGSSLDGAKWTDYSDSASYSIVVSGGSCVLTESGGAASTRMKTTNTFSLDAAGAAGAQVVVSGATGVSSYLTCFDNSSGGVGVAFQIVAGSVQRGGWVDSPVAYNDYASGGVADSMPSVFRVAKNGSNIELSSSIDGGTTWNVDDVQAIGSINTAAMRIGFYLNSGSLTIDDVTVAGTGAGGIADDDTGMPGPLHVDPPMWIATVFS